MASSEPPTKEKLHSIAALGITYALFLWPALTLAVREQFGGPDSSGKREWLAAEMVSLTLDSNDHDEEDLEEVLLQVMGDEFEVLIEDDSAEELAKRMVQIRTNVMGKGDTRIVEALQKEWERVGGKDVNIARAGGEDEDEEDDSSGSEDEDGGAEMEDVPQLVVKEKIAPEIDEDGFTKVVGKRRK